MRVLLAFSLILACGSLRAEQIGEGKTSGELSSFLRAHYRPNASLSYRKAREMLFSTIDNRGGRVRCVCTGEVVATQGIPDARNMNTEHAWPQSKFGQRMPMRADLHHLFPAMSRVNQVRGDLPFAEVKDEECEGWWNSNSLRRDAPTPVDRDAFSESTRACFEPREDHKGNTARAMLYFWAIYSEDSVMAEWIEPQLETLLRWHELDPANDEERSRSQKIKAVQGNENPFVVDATLAARFVRSRAMSSIAVDSDSSPSKRRISTRFPDFKLEYKPPEDQYRGEFFRLSQDYPQKEPVPDAAVQSILSIPYDRNEGGAENWKKYLLAVRDYCFEGNILKDVEWQGQDNPVRRWYHVPWQHYGEKGREGIHGLTREASAKPGQLADSQRNTHETHAVALYNAQGGYTIGRVWANQFEPDVSRSTFPLGTVVVKVLFTQAKEDEVSYLENPVLWKAYVRDPRDPTKRSVQNLRLIQMDIMVRDPRANQTGGWTFGTYCYNGALNNKISWYNLVPVGLQWGNDPDVTLALDNPTSASPIRRPQNPNLKETVINQSAELPPQHLGWGGRLNGPCDYHRSSCMSCHATAQYPVIAHQHPDFNPRLDIPPGSSPWMKWFRNLKCGEAFNHHEDTSKRAITTDFSLQLAIGIDNFYQWKSQAMGGYFTPVIPGHRPPSTQTETVRPSSE